MSNEAIAERYARALFDIGVENGNLTRLTEELSSFADIYAGSKELRDVLDNPLVLDAQRHAVLDEIGRRIGLGELVLNAIRLLVTRRRIRQTPTVAQALRKMKDEVDGILRATVVSARPLSKAYEQRLQSELQKLTGKSVLLTCEVDASLIAGVVTRLGDKVIDGSLRSRLDELRNQLLAE